MHRLVNNKQQNKHKLEKKIILGCPQYHWIARSYNIQNKNAYQAYAKRFLDLMLCIPGIIFLSPLFFIISLIIKLESSGPVIYKQKRLGLNGKEFYMYKFRSMYNSAERHEDAIRSKFDIDDQIMFKLDNDPRITKVGKFIRKYSIDELPQLINVIKGEMSLVGPRPRQPKDLQQFEKWHYIFFAAIPGITGMWQTSGRSSIKDFDTVVALESDYIRNWNFLLDLKILFKTIPVVLSGNNTV